MSPAFGFSVGDFIAAIELCTKVAKALKDAEAAAVEYQQVVLELQGLQNILIRLAALEPTESNIQYVNAIRGAALASTLPLREFLSRLEKFNGSMSPAASKKTASLNRAGRQTQYALFMADEIKKIRPIIYGNVLRINVMLTTHASESLSRTEGRLATDHRHVIERFDEARGEMAKLSKQIEDVKTSMAEYQDETRRETLRSTDRPSKSEAEAASLLQGISGLSIGIGTIANSVSGVRNLSTQILALLRLIPEELGSMIQSVIRLNARIESSLLRIDRNIAATPSQLHDTNIRMEDALGRSYSLPFEWFRDWETFEGMLKAKFRDVPGRQKIDSGDFHLVHAKRPSISLDKDSWSGTIHPGAHLLMLILITDLSFQASSCPRRSCTGKILSGAGTAGLATCPECGLRFSSQLLPAGSAGLTDVEQPQQLEDAKLFGSRDLRNGPEDAMTLERITPEGMRAAVKGSVVETPHLVDATMEISERQILHMERPESLRNKSGLGLLDASATAISPIPEPPIMSWLAHTLPPMNPESIHQERDAAEARKLELKEREAKDLEIFRNVQLVLPPDFADSRLHTSIPGCFEESGLGVGTRVFYRNIIDRYPKIDGRLAKRLASANWQRQKRFADKQREAERAKARERLYETLPDDQHSMSLGNMKTAAGDVSAKADGLGADDGDRGDRRARKRKIETMKPSLQLVELRNHREASPEQATPAADDPFSPQLTPPREDSVATTRHGMAFNPPSLDMRQRKHCSLPPLPLPVTEKDTSGVSMLCYLCYRQIHIREKRNWRTHVMDDLQLYMCRFADCVKEDEMYPRRTSMLRHMKACHRKSEIFACPFCGDAEIQWAALMELGPNAREYAKHVGRHMEEISFAVISTAYEDWSYDEMLSEPDVLETRHCIDAWNGVMNVCRTCEKEFKRARDLKKHEKSHSRPWKCTEEKCKYFELGWSTERERDRHINDKHNHYVPQYHCQYPPCQYASKRESNCRMHMEKAHGFVGVRSRIHSLDDNNKITDQTNFWTGTHTPASSASSVNSRLRDPSPTDGLSPDLVAFSTPDFDIPDFGTLDSS